MRYPHAALREVLEPTYGVITYQEQVMRMAQVLAGFTLARLGYDDETAPLQQLTCGRAEGCVVVDDQNTATHERILPAQVGIRSVASSTLPR